MNRLVFLLAALAMAGSVAKAAHAADRPVTIVDPRALDAEGFGFTPVRHA